MSQFDFTEAQEAFRREVARFTQKELLPGVKGRLKNGFIEHELVKKIGDLGLLGINLPPSYGGNQADWVSLGIATEELAKVDPMAAHLPALHIAISGAILKGEKEIIKEWLPALISGEKIGCMALTEPDAGSDVAALKCRATKSGSQYILNGEKAPISFGRQADVALVYAKTDPGQGVKGISCFLLPANLTGVSRSPLAALGNSEGLASMYMEDARVPLNYLLGKEGEGFSIVMGLLDITRVGASLIALGMAESSLEEAIKYTRERVTFGKPIAKYEAISFKIAEDATRIEAARLLCYRALSLKDKGLPCTKEAAMCKWFCPEVALRAVHNSLLIHGFVGYSEDYSVEQRLRDTIGEELASGTAEMMKIIISQQIIGKIASPFD